MEQRHCPQNGVPRQAHGQESDERNPHISVGDEQQQEHEHRADQHDLIEVVSYDFHQIRAIVIRV